MAAGTTLKLSRLREIGWTVWDPIGLNELEDRPDDEYDDYLLNAAGQLWNGRSDEEVADYLVKIETEHMGLDAFSDIRSRALEVARTMRSYVETLRI